MKLSALLFLCILWMPFNMMAQNSRIESSTITIPNSTRSVMNLKVSDRRYSPLKKFSLPESNTPSLVTKDFTWSIDTLLDIPLPSVQDMRANEKDKIAYGDKYTNAVQIGLGNYGHSVFKFKAGNSKNENRFLGFNVNHDANQFGPVQSEYSARSENQIRLESRYLGQVNYWESMLTYKQFSNYYYGSIPAYTKAKEIEAAYTMLSADGKLSSANKSSASDYVFSVSGDLLRNSTDLSEFVMKAHAIYARNLSEKLRLKLAGDYIISEYIPNATLQKWTRNLYRLNPHLAYKSSRISLNAGFLFVTESDEPAVEKTSVFPMLQLDYGASDYIHIFGGIGGDVQFNTFQSFLQQNPWMRAPSQLKNSNQVAHLYGGFKGVGGNKKVDFEAKYDYAEYSDLPFLINAVGASNKFDVQYRGGLEKVQVTTFTGNINVNFTAQFTSSLKFNHVIYQQLGVEFQAPHVPSTTLSWTNSWRLSPKILISPDVYWMNSLYYLIPDQNQLKSMPDILDVNFKINYFIKRNLNLGLAGNNLLGKNYERFHLYQVQGLNATMSLAYSF